MDTIVMIGQVLLALGILVGLHEAGHMFAAKAFGMRVEKFSIGFPPKVFSFKKGETEYSLGMIPLGGFVKITGMVDESFDTKDLDKAPEPYEFRAKPAWQRLIVMMGGIIVNVITGIIIFIFVVFIWGKEVLPTETLENGIHTGELAERMNLQTGDQIIALNGVPVDQYQSINKLNSGIDLLADGSYYTVKRKVSIPVSDSSFQKELPSNVLISLDSNSFKQLKNAFVYDSETKSLSWNDTVNTSISIVDSNLTTNEIRKSLNIEQTDRITAINGFNADSILALDELNLQDSAVFTLSRTNYVSKDSIFDLPIPTDLADYLREERFWDVRSGFLVDSVFKTWTWTEDHKVYRYASEAGLRANDQIVTVNNQQIQYFDEFQSILKENKGDSVTIGLIRSGDSVTIASKVDTNGMLGFKIKLDIESQMDTLRFSFFQSIGEGTKDAFNVLWSNVIGIKKMITGEISARKSLSGPIGIAKMFGSTWDWRRFWSMTGLLSMILAFMNFLPIPALDGGHVMFLLYEMISGRKPSDKFMEVALKIGIVILITIMVFAFGNDIIRLIFG